MQQVVQPRSSANGFGRRKVDRGTGNRQENKLQLGKSNPGRLTNTGVLTGSSQSPSCDRLIYLTTCLIGHHVDVQVKNGSMYSGIFHATNTEKDFGIILKMARLTKDATFRGQKASSEALSKAPLKTLIIPANDLVQVIAKDVSVTTDRLSRGLLPDKEQEIMIDSYISHSRHVDVERELERWVPDEDDSVCPELENIFDGPWNRNWDQFQANEALFGVTSTFDEELYTTKLERGPQMRELEREALRIAREIEGEDTRDLHLAEERGIVHDDLDFDEETRFSSVLRTVDDSGYEESDDIMLDSRNIETFEGSSNSISCRTFTNLTSGKATDGAQVLSSSSSMDEVHASQSSAGRDLYRSGSNDHARQLASSFVSLDGERRIENQCSEQKGGSNYANESVEKELSAEEAQTSKSNDSLPSLNMTKDGSDKGGLSPNATAYAPSTRVSKGPEKMSPPSELSEVAVSQKMLGGRRSVNSRGQPNSSTSSPLDSAGATSAFGVSGGLSPSSSVGSLSSERSTLNPHAKEFKLNPNAKSFTPSQTSARPVSPVPDGSFYYPTSVPAVPHIPGMPVGIGIGPSYAGHQPVIFNPQAGPMQSPQPYFHPNGPQYGQQMILGHPRQVMYMPSYPPEMPYKGRDY